jgi:peroxiredoxin
VLVAGGTARGKASARGLTAIRLESAGKAKRLDAFRSKKALVLVFLGMSCPISNSYSETLSRLQREYGPRGVQLVGVFANPDEDAAKLAAHARDFKLPFPLFKDARQELADAVGAQVTPEAVVLDASRKVRYRGRIDDGYATRTKKASSVQSRDLEAAIEAVLAGKVVAVAETPAIGCAIYRPAKEPARSAAVTYHRDVAPILQQRCESCHRPGQVAPFSLLTYADARSWANEIKEFSGNRQMPPWLAEPGHGDFADARRLPDAEVATLAAWADAGAPEGDRKDAPPPKQWSDSWMLGKPDVLLKVAEPYEVAASGEDEFHCFVLPTELVKDEQVVAIDFRPGNSRVVHHVVTFVDTSGQARKLDAADPAPGYTSGPGGIKVPTATIQGVWAPGNLPRFLPSGVGRLLPKGADLVVQMHYHKTGKAETDQTQVALYFAKEPVKRQARTAIFGPFSIDIPAGAPKHEVKLTWTTPLELTVLNIMPHMHLLGKDFKVTATYPDGKQESLVWIKDWDYRWQDSYRYRQPLHLPQGTKMELVASFDNSSANPRNPSNPPRRVTFGEQTTDEMAFAIMEIVPGNIAELKP